MHARAESIFDVAVFHVGAEAANVGALVDVVGVEAAVHHQLLNQSGRLNPVQYGHAVVHKYQAVWLALAAYIDVHVPLLHHLLRLLAANGYIRLDPQIGQKQLEQVEYKS